MLGDFDRLKKEEIERRKRQRLEEVRQQSKQIAAQVRRKFQEEKQRQLRQVEESKAKELNCIRRLQAQRAQAGYEACLFQVGEAHIAAAKENELTKKLKQQKVRNDILAKRRSREAKQRLILNKKPTPPTDTKRQRPKSVTTQVDTRQTSANSNRSHTRSHIYAQVNINDEPNDCSSESEAENRPPVNSQAPNTESNVEFINISSESLSSSLELIAIDSKLSNTLPLACVSEKTTSGNTAKQQDNETKPQLPHYNPANFMANDSTDNSIQNGNSLPFTQVTELINKRRKAYEDPTSTTESRVITIELESHSAFLPARNNGDTLNTLEMTPISPRKKIASQPITTVSSIKSKSPQKSMATKRPISKPLYGSISYKSTVTSPKSTPQNSMQKVQFYDHANRFSKQYHPNSNIVQKIPPEFDKPNAIQAAQDELLLDEIRQQRNQELQRNTELRSQQCLEKEKIRKDYEALNRQLEDLVKQENYAKLFSNAENYAARPFPQSNIDKQKVMNGRFEEIFHQPVVITCPRLDAGVKPTDPDNSQSSAEINIASSSRFIPGRRDTQIQSSESCSSVLLGYMDGRTRELSQVIDSHSNNDVKRDDLLKLLDRINKLKSMLLKEIEKTCDTVPISNLEEIMKSLQHIDKEKDDILVESNKENVSVLEKEKKELDKREKMLKKKENALERRVKQLFLEEHRKKNIEDKANQTTQQIPNIEIQTDNVGREYIDIVENSTDTTTTSMGSPAAPVKIIIKVNDKKHKKRTKLRDIHIQTSDSATPSCTLTKLGDSPGKVFPKTPAKRPVNKPKIIQQQDAVNPPDGSSISTAYRSPPRVIHTEFSKYVCEKRYNPAPEKRSSKQPTKIENPILKHYITRLLGMSRASIEQLGVSSSTSIETPSTSIINVSGNMTSSCVPSIDENRLENLQKFIDDNYSFLSELEQSLKHRDLNETNESDMRVVEQIWMKTLKEKEQEMKRSKNKNKKLKETTENREDQVSKTRHVHVEPVKPILKNVDKESKQNTIQPKHSVQTDGMIHEDLNKKYAELAAHCTKRFAHLNEMIHKVRQEKQKLLEGTFSSKTNSNTSGDPDQKSTEFLEFLNAGGGNKVAGESNDNSQATDIKSLSYKDDLLYNDNEQHILIQSKQIGMSRDSGICISRPVTSSEIRDSPDIKLLQKDLSGVASKQPGNCEKIGDTFEPLLKGIPKYEIRLEQRNVEQIEQGTSKEDHQKKSNRPPTTLTRYSPQFEKLDIPHELSTIIEVDTPATSHLNTSIQESNVAEQIIPTAEAIAEFKKFPSFHEYAKQQNLDLTKFDPEQSSRLENEFKKILEMSLKNFDLEYRKFMIPPPPDSSAGEQTKVNLIDITEPSDLFYKPHEPHQELKLTKSQSSSTSSLPDVEAELKKRNLLTHPLQVYKPELSDEGKTNASQEEHNTSKKKTISDLRKSSNSDALEDELQKMGIKWAGSMIRKTKQALALSSSTSTDGSHDRIQIQKTAELIQNSFIDKNIEHKSILSDGGTSTTSSSSDITPGNLKPVSLRDFFMRELLKKSRSSSSAEDSSTLTSNLFKSLLSSTCGTPSPNRDVHTDKQATPQRTSTPLKESSTPSFQASMTAPASNLFSGESALSSVRHSSALSSSANTNSIKNIYDELTVPKVKLSLPSLTSTSTSSS